MSNKKVKEVRQDNKGRNLRIGESQRKDGRYAYKYIGADGKPKFLYAWKLNSTDKTPKGKRDDLSLREKIKEALKDLDDGIDTQGKKMTVCQLYIRHTNHKGNVRRGTKKGRQYLLDILKADPLGAKRIDTVKVSDAKAWVVRMKDKGYSFKTVNNYKRSLKAVFYSAIQDDFIRKNPFDFQVADVISDDTTPKQPLTQEQETAMLDFLKVDKVYRKYYDEIVILLGTGLRISEFCGLTEHDINFETRTININHQLLKDSGIGYYTEPPKTDNGKRQLYMSNEVYDALKRVIKNRPKAEPIVVDGYRNFLFLNKSGYPKVTSNYETMFRGLVKKYNKYHEDSLPNITPHILRHTFCTRFANAGMNPKSLQYIMGHANINMTLNYYAHSSYDTAKAEMMRLIA